MTFYSTTHLVIIPSYNTGQKVIETVEEAYQFWNPIWVIIDGSTDGTAEQLKAFAENRPGIEIHVLPQNIGKGAAVLHGLSLAADKGFTHALTMDADGQHPAYRIPEFMQVSQQQPNSMVLGRPVFDASAPTLRVRGRKISNWWANLETLWQGIGDSLFGFRVYPIIPLRNVMRHQFWMKRFDFDPEAAVRLCWKGIKPINVDAPVKYLRADEGGVSHFNYLRDNVLLTWMHLRLFSGFVLRFPLLLIRKLFS